MSTMRTLERQLRRMVASKVQVMHLSDLRARRGDPEDLADFLQIGGPSPVDVSSAFVSVSVPDASGTEESL